MTTIPDDEAKYWKRVAVWLANCHAATAEYDGSLKSTSKRRLGRLVEICRKADLALGGDGSVAPIGRGNSIEWVRGRLQAVVSGHEQQV